MIGNAADRYRGSWIFHAAGDNLLDVLHRRFD
jgi:hypothetical protein